MSGNALAAETVKEIQRFLYCADHRFVPRIGYLTHVHVVLKVKLIDQPVICPIHSPRQQ